MKKTFVGMVERTAQWDRSKEAHEQPGFADHAAYMGALEQEGFIAMAGLLAQSEHILFVFLADSALPHRRTRGIGRLSRGPGRPAPIG